MEEKKNISDEQKIEKTAERIADIATGGKQAVTPAEMAKNLAMATMLLPDRWSSDNEQR